MCIGRHRHRSLALTLIVGLVPGFSVEGFSQRVSSPAAPGVAREVAGGELPDDPGQQQTPSPMPKVPAPQSGPGSGPGSGSGSGPGSSLGPAPGAGNAPAMAQAPGVAQPSAPGTIRGLITDRDGVPYQGVQVTLTRSSAAALNQPNSAPVALPDVRMETTDGQGRFEFRSVAAGPFQLSVASDGFATQVRTGTLNAGESLEEAPIALLLVATNSEIQVTASQHDIAQAQMKQEEQQRVLGVIPNFFVVYAPNAPPLSARQKYHLALRYSVDPVSFLAAAVFAGIEQEDDDFKGYGQGAEGYAKRFGAAYGDSFIGGMLGSAVFPALFKQDPRYFYKGTGTKKARAMYAIESAFICRGDNGKRQFNYSGILGGLGGAGISNLYYPAADRNGAGLTFENTGIGIGTGALQNLFQEFIVRHLTPKLPDYGPAKP